MEYKVFLYAESVLASIFLNGGKVNPVRLTEALNRQAEEGWEVVTMEREKRRTLLLHIYPPSVYCCFYYSDKRSGFQWPNEK